MLEILKINKELEENKWLEIKLKHGKITISKRPQYCDRGRYEVNVFSSNILELHVDEADGFPRYYFYLVNLISEVEAWIYARGQEII